MKKKLIILLIILLIAIIGVLIWKITTSKNFSIPEDYNLKLQENNSNIDGEDIIYYVYNNKIIIEKISYYPLGHPKGTMHRVVTIYEDVITSDIKEINDIRSLINNKKGKEVYNAYK